MINTEIHDYISKEFDENKDFILATAISENLNDSEVLNLWLNVLEQLKNKVKLRQLEVKQNHLKVFDTSLIKVFNNNILLNDEAFRLLDINDILDQVDEVINAQSSNSINDDFNVIIDKISNNQEVKEYLRENRITMVLIKNDIYGLMNKLKNNVKVTASSQDVNQRKKEYQKMLKGFSIIVKILKDKPIDAMSVLGCLTMISDASKVCSSGWINTLLELIMMFSSDIKEKFGDMLNFNKKEDPLKLILSEIFFDARNAVTNDLSYKFMRSNNMGTNGRAHYIDIFIEVFNESYQLNLPFIKTTDTTMSSNRISELKIQFLESLKNVNVKDLIFNKACELFCDRLRAEPKYYKGSKVKKFWGEIADWAKKYYEKENFDFLYSDYNEFMNECIMNQDNYEEYPVRYVAIKEIMKYYGFIDEFEYDLQSGIKFYNAQKEIMQKRILPALMDIRNEEESIKLNNELISLHIEGINIKFILDYIRHKNKLNLLQYIDDEILNIYN